MTQEEKELVIKDLCGRLPYSSVQIHISYEDGFKYDKTLTYEDVKNYSQLPACSTTIVKPYLRPMSSMTEGERRMYKELSSNFGFTEFHKASAILIGWLNQKMFDYRGLIPNGLALEAPEGMYKN